MTQMDTMIKIEGLKKKFGEFLAVDGLNFDIYRNEVFGLLGPNGAGKTTTISMICGLLPISEGKITFDNHHQVKTVNRSLDIVLRKIFFIPN